MSLNRFWTMARSAKENGTTLPAAAVQRDNNYIDALNKAEDYVMTEERIKTWLESLPSLTVENYDENAFNKMFWKMIECDGFMGNTLTGGDAMKTYTKAEQRMQSFWEDARQFPRTMRTKALTVVPKKSAFVPLLMFQWNKIYFRNEVSNSAIRVIFLCSINLTVLFVVGF